MSWQDTAYLFRQWRWFPTIVLIRNNTEVWTKQWRPVDNRRHRHSRGLTMWPAIAPRSRRRISTCHGIQRNRLYCRHLAEHFSNPSADSMATTQHLFSVERHLFLCILFEFVTSIMLSGKRLHLMLFPVNTIVFCSDHIAAGPAVPESNIADHILCRRWKQRLFAAGSRHGFMVRVRNWRTIKSKESGLPKKDEGCADN